MPINIQPSGAGEASERLFSQPDFTDMKSMIQRVNWVS